MLVLDAAVLHQRTILAMVYAPIRWGRWCLGFITL